MPATVIVLGADGAVPRCTVDAVLAGEDELEVVVVDDARDGRRGDAGHARHPDVRWIQLDAPVPASVAGNLAAGLASGDHLVFAGSWIVAAAGWLPSLVAVLKRSDVGAVSAAMALAADRRRIGGLTWTGPALDPSWVVADSGDPAPVPLLTGRCIAMRRDVFQRCGGFDTGMLLSRGAAAELSLRLWRAGYECWVVPQADITIRFGAPGNRRPAPEAALHDRLRLAFSHLAAARIETVLGALQHRRAFAAALARAVDGDAGLRRKAVAASALRDDGSFLERFAIPTFE